MDGWIFLTIAAAISAGVFLNGVRFARMTANPWAGKRLFGMPLSGSKFSVERVRFVGRLNMVFAPLFFLVIAALCFGLFGPVQGIHVIRL